MIRIVGSFRDRALDAELEEDVRSHLEMAAEEYVALGMSPREAARDRRQGDPVRTEVKGLRPEDLWGLAMKSTGSRRGFSAS